MIGEVMAQMRTRGAAGCRMLLALVNGNLDAEAFECRVREFLEQY